LLSSTQNSPRLIVGQHSRLPSGNPLTTTTSSCRNPGSRRSRTETRPGSRIRLPFCRRSAQAAEPRAQPLFDPRRIPSSDRRKLFVKNNLFSLVAPQGTTIYETKGDIIFSTVFPKFFPKRILRMCIPVTALLRTSSYYPCAVGRSGREGNLSYAFAIKSTKTLNRDSISVAEVVE
jgi:hypothetical protein